MSFKCIDEEHLDYLEKWVRDDLLAILQKKCEREKTQLEINDLEIFYGMYVSSPNEFKLLKGDRLHMTVIAEELRKRSDSMGLKKYTDFFQMPKEYKITKRAKSDTAQFLFGNYYGPKRPNRLNNRMIDSDDAPSMLLAKLKPLFESFSKQITPHRDINLEIIKIVEFDNGMRADVVCIFCPSNDTNIDVLLKRFSVQYDKSGHWNLSNLRRHIKLKHLMQIDLNTTTKENDNTEENDSNFSQFELHTDTLNDKKVCKSESDVTSKMRIDLNSLDISSLPIEFDDDPAVVSRNSTLNGRLYSQFASQNLKLLESAITNCEKQKFMVSNVDERCVNITVVKIASDGNCLFSSLVHQLKFVKIGSSEHIELTKRLRQKVVTYIRENITDFVQAIYYRSDYKYQKLKKEHLILLKMNCPGIVIGVVLKPC